MSNKERLDILLVNRGLFESREKAKAAIMACIVVFYLMGDSDLCRFFGKTYAIDSRRRYSSDTCGQ